ncbi:PALM2-AKAP2 fusion protein-like [Rhinoraja longicauda]
MRDIIHFKRHIPFPKVREPKITGHRFKLIPTKSIVLTHLPTNRSQVGRSGCSKKAQVAESSQKQQTSVSPITVVNEIESDQAATTSKDLLHRELPASGTLPIGISEGGPKWAKGSESDKSLTEIAQQIPAGTEHRVHVEAIDELPLQEGEGNKIVLSRDLKTPSETEDGLEDEAPVPMQKAESNAFSVENGVSVNMDVSNVSLQHETNVYPNLTPITQNSSVPSFSAIPFSIDCGDDSIIHAVRVPVIQDMSDQGTLNNDGLGSVPSAVTTARDGKLTSIKKEANFDLRKYDKGKNPTKLFSDDEERKYQTVIIKETTGGDILNKERRDIIRNQAVKKSTTIAETHVSTKSLHLEETPSVEDSTQKQDESQIQKSTEHANSFSFHDEPSNSHPEDINSQQKNFVAARQQFLQMEKSRQEEPTSPRPSAQSHRVLGHSSTPSESTLHDKGGIVLDTSPTIMVKAVRVNYTHDDEKDNGPESHVSNSVFIAEKIATLEDNDGERCGSTRRNLAACSSTDDLDSGLGEMTNDYGYGYTSDGGASNEMQNIGTDNSCAYECPEQKPILETPIEKEIRLALEREEILRKERGISKSVNSEEMVEIKTKPLLSQPSPGSTFLKHKDKNRMVFFVQREIEMDSKREEKLKEEGKVKGLYDKGVPQEVEERKKVFEQQTDDVPVLPQPAWQTRLVRSASRESLDVHDVLEESNSVQSYSTDCQELAERRSESQPYTLRLWKPQTHFLIEQEIEEEQRREAELRAQRLRQLPGGSLPSETVSTSESQSPPGYPKLTSGDGALNGDRPEDLLATHCQEERRAKPFGKKDDSTYAGIEPSDDVNTEVLESTRVIRRKSTMAQRWEAGIFNNHLDE